MVKQTQNEGRAKDNDEDLGGQYTRAVASAVVNYERMSPNISCLMESMSKLEGD